MNDSITRISLDIHSTSSKDTVNAKRGDTARRIVISLVDGGIPYVISKDCYAVFTAKKPDGNVVYNDCTIENNTIIYKLTEQTVAVEGRVNSEIKLYGADDKLITSPKFTIAVFGTVYDEGDEIESSDEFNALTRLVSEAMEATENANKAAEKAAHTAKALMVIGKEDGTSIQLYDAIEQYLVGLRIYGKTTQEGVPTPDNPVELVSAGDSGYITVNVIGEKEAQSIIIATPNGLHGIPVTTGGNYTDANGQQWICDEVDLVRGVYVRRVRTLVFDGSDDESWGTTSVQYYIPILDKRSNHTNVGSALLCSHFKTSMVIDRSLGFVTETYYQDGNVSVLFNYDNGEGGLNNFVTWLQANPITLQYVLATPIETPLTEEQLAAYAALYTYKDHTTVSNDAGAYMELEYVMDAKKYINSLVAGGASAGILDATVE